MTIMMDFSPSFLSLLVFQDHVSFYSHDQLEIHYVDEAVLEKKKSVYSPSPSSSSSSLSIPLSFLIHIH